MVGAHVNLGNTLETMNRMEEALVSYDKALALEPDHVEANFNVAVTRLCIGDFQEGWKQYEYRWERRSIGWRPCGVQAAGVAR